MTDAERLERDELKAALEAHGGVFARVASALGINEVTVARRVRRYRLDGLACARNDHLRAKRRNRAQPPAATRQATHQQKNRELGLCGCGRPRAERPGRGFYRQCAVCRERDSRRKGSGQRDASAPADPVAVEDATACRARCRDAW